MGATVRAKATIHVSGHRAVGEVLALAMKLGARFDSRAVEMHGNALEAVLNLDIDDHTTIHGECEVYDGLKALAKLAAKPFRAHTGGSEPVWYGKRAKVRRARMEHALREAKTLMRQMRLEPAERGALAAELLLT